jgi:hypothetical protein
MAKSADQSDNIQTEFVLGQDESPLGFGSQGDAVSLAVGVVAGPDLESESGKAVEGGDDAAGGIGDP